MNKIYYQIDHDFILVSQFSVDYVILYWIYKFTLETKLENALENKKGRWQAFGPADPAAQQGTRPTHEMAQDGDPALAL